MAIIVRGKKGEDNNAMIRKFKKLLMIDDIVTAVRDRRYHKNDATKRKEAAKLLASKLYSEKKRLARGRRPLKAR
jgi:hypothetical protein